MQINARVPGAFEVWEREEGSVKKGSKPKLLLLLLLSCIKCGKGRRKDKDEEDTDGRW